MKYKVGDKVRIKSLDWYNKNRDKIDQIDCGNAYFVRNMATLCGEIVTISSILPTLEVYRIKEDDGTFNWTDEMIEGLVEEEFERSWDKPKKERFDVNTLQPFDKVLMRTNERSIWEPDFFGYKDGNWIMCVTTGNVECIPYNEETKHLVGTSDDCPEYYKWWEE